MGIAVGIDLGTTNTVVATVVDGKATSLVDDEGSPLIPSVVSFHPSGSVLVGHKARERRIIDSRNTIFSVKRLLGRPWGSAQVQSVRRGLPFELREGTKNAVMVVARGEEYTLPEISALVLERARQVAEAALGDKVDRAVITVPANFNDLQRAATKVAASLAEIDVLRILNEPTAAALAYGQESAAQGERIAVYDLGGGTFDITLLELSGPVYEVLATGGDTMLGGDDIDALIATRMAEACLQQHRFDPAADQESFARLRVVAETLKHELSAKYDATVTVPELIPSTGGKQLDFVFKMRRTELEILAAPVVERTFEVCRNVFEKLGVDPMDIDRTILAGGSTRMPLVGHCVEEFFDKPPYARMNPDEVVAYGAALQARALDRGPGARAGTMVALHGPASSRAAGPIAPTMPGDVAPVSSRGAAPPSKATRQPLLIDVTPMSLTVETAGGFCDVLVEQNMPVPCDRTRTFSTASDGQTSVIIRIAQGESKHFGENTYLGELELAGIPPAPRGTAQISVTFEIDADGILNVVARDLLTKTTQSARIHLVGAHTEAGELKRMQQRHAKHEVRGS